MTTRPNIVLIVVDDMGYGDFGFVNGGISSTPALDQLAADGLVFPHHYAASPVCAPARAAILTGRYPQRTGVIDTLEARGGDRMALDEITLADELSAAGYRTGLVGKWHSGSIGDAYAPTQRGFDEFAGFRGGWQDYWSWRLEIDGRVVPSDGRYLTHVLTDEAIAFVRRRSPGRPFFLHLAYNAPHFPFQAPEPVVARHRQEGRSERVAVIYAMLEEVDRGIAALRQELADAGLAEDTLLVVTSDNGPELGGTGDDSSVRFNAGLAGHKGLVLEGGIRVPLLISWPAGLSGGERRDTFVHGVDLVPTLLDLAGVDRIGELPLDGRSAAPEVRSGTESDGPARFWQWSRYAPMLHANAAMRDGPWKLVRPAVPGMFDVTAEDARIDADVKAHPDRYPEVRDEPVRGHRTPDTHVPLLFDLSADPEETTDLSHAHPQVVRRMEDALTAWFETVERDRERIPRSKEHHRA
jgi:arylsulfatase A-like enzyme